MKLRIEVSLDNRLATRWVDDIKAVPSEFYELAQVKLKECFDQLVPVKKVVDVPPVSVEVVEKKRGRSRAK